MLRRGVPRLRLVKNFAQSGFVQRTRCFSQDRRKRKFRDFNIAMVSGVLIVASYLSYNDYLSSDTIFPGGRNSGQITSGASFDTSSFNDLSLKQNKQGVHLLSDEQVSQRLREFEESYFVKRGKGVLRYDVCQLASNNPIEDDRSERILQIPIQDRENNNEQVNSDWMFWGVFDGHSGWTTSAKLRDHLINYVVDELSQVFKVGDKNLRLVPSNDVIDKAIRTGFLKLDDEIVNKSVEKLFNINDKAAAAELLMPALSGSCGLLSFYDTHTKSLKVAVTGDSRAILGSLNDENQWTVTALSADQTGSNPTEVAKMISEHPSEPNVIRNGRVLGSLEPTRAFGDSRYKWSRDIQSKIYNQFFGRTSPANLRTPPYVTAEPVITTTEVNPSNNDFMVMASDGLYEMLSNEEIVGLVVKWMENKKMVKPNKTLISKLNPFGSTGDKKLPSVISLSDVAKNQAKQPFRRNSSGSDYLLQDENVSTHLIRNALSNGGSKEQTSMLMSIPSPLSRRYRDDLTVTVVFFGDDEAGANDSGKLEINKAATKGDLNDVKSKL